MRRYETHSEAETRAVAAELAQNLSSGDIVAFTGGMGVGKTAFTRALAAAVGCRDEVSSPTFSLVHVYEGKMPICHFDMYRIHDFEDLYSTGFFDYVDTDALLVVEWSENVREFLPEQTIWVHMSAHGDNKREILIEGGGLS